LRSAQCFNHDHQLDASVLIGLSPLIVPIWTDGRVQ
jgi:hypothetical protein